MPPSLHMFSKKEDLMLIESVRLNPTLYDPNDDYATNAIMKNNIWKNISESLNIPILDLKRRWRHFRNHFNKKLNRMAAGQTSNRPWEHMEKLSFLTPKRYQRMFRRNNQNDGIEQVTFVLPPENEMSCHESTDSDDTYRISEVVTHPDPPKRRRSSEMTTSQENKKCRKAAKRRKVTDTAIVPEKPQMKGSTHESVGEAGGDAQSTDKCRDLYHDETKCHNEPFFQSMAQLVCGFSPRLAVEARTKVLILLRKMEKKMDLELNDNAEQMRWQTCRIHKREK